MPRVTVAICTYNRAESGYLAQAIESVIHQTYSDIDIVVYDNASADGTEDVVRGFIERDARVRYVKNETNLGLFGNLNKALDCCGTEYIVVFHDDDVMLPHMIETEVKMLDEYPNAVMCGQTYLANMLVEQKGDFIAPAKLKPTKETVFKKHDLINDNLERGGNLFSCPSVMFRRERLEKLGLKFSHEVGLAADWMLWLELNCTDYEIIGINHAIMKNRVHPNSTSNMSKIYDWCDSHARIEAFLKNKGFNNLGKIEDYFVRVFMLPTIQKNLDGEYVDVLSLKRELNQAKNELRKMYGWDVSQRALDSLGSLFLGDMVIKVGMKKANFSDYEQRRKEAKEIFGYSPSKIRQIKWGIKYFGPMTLFRRLSKSVSFNLSRAYKNIISIPSYVSFLMRPIRENSVLIVETYDSHAEILPGYSKYLIDIGYNIDVITTISEGELDAFCRFKDDRISRYSFQPSFMKRMFCSRRIESYEQLFIASYFENLFFMDIEKIKRPIGSTTLVIHEGFAISDTIRENCNLISLAEIDCGGIKNQTSIVNPHYFGNVRESNGKNEKTTFIAIGVIERERRNYEVLMSAVDRLVGDGINNFSIVVVGKGNLSGYEHLSDYFRIVGKNKRMGFPTLYDELEKADFILALLDPEDKRHDRYITTGTSGNFQLCYGFKKPILIHEKFAETHRFTKENSVIYEKNVDLYVAMREAIEMDSNRYCALKKNLAETSEQLSKKSLDNLRGLLKK